MTSSCHTGSDLLSASLGLGRSWYVEKRFIGNRPAEDLSPVYHIGFGIDSAYLRPMSALMASLCMHNPELTMTFHVMSSCLSREELCRLEALSHYHQVDINVYQLQADLLATLPTRGYFSTAVYYRLLLPKVVPAEKVLYLDSDILCLGDIRPLLDTTLEGYVMAVVRDLPKMVQTRMAEMQIPTYFNSGMQLINVAAWNREQISERAVALLVDDARSLPSLDQDALNLLQAGKALMLDGRWNFLLKETRDSSMLQEVSQQAHLLHCIGYTKPWMAFYDSPLIQQRYLAAEQHTPWAGTPLQMPSTPWDIKRHARMLWRNRHYWRSAVQYLHYKLAKVKRKKQLA